MKGRNIIAAAVCVWFSPWMITAQPQPSTPVHPQASHPATTRPEVADHVDHPVWKKSTKSKPFRRFRHFSMSRLGPDGNVTNTSARNMAALSEMKRNGMLGANRSSYHGNWQYIGPDDMQQPDGDPANNQGRVNRFGFHPTDPDIVYCATAGGGVWRTLDKGLHWEPLSDGVPVLNMTGVVVDPTDTDILYVISGDGSGVGSFDGFSSFSRTSVGVFKSQDDGVTWEPTGLMFQEEDAVLSYNLIMKPDDPMTLYACTSAGLFRTADGGSSWNLIREGLVYELEFKPGDPDHLYVVNDVYVFVSDDAGNTWIDSTLIPDIDGEFGRMCISVCENNPAIVYLIASPIDTLKLNDSIPDHRGVWLSADSGGSFILMSTRPNFQASDDPLEFKSQAWYDFSLECNPLDFNDILASAIGIWKSEDAGVTWTHDNGINNFYHADVHAMEVNPLDQTLWVATDGGVFISPDFGETYEFRSGQLGIAQYYKVVTSFHAPNFTLAGAQDNGVQLRDDEEILFDMLVFADGMESAFHPLSPRIVWTSAQIGRILLSQDTAQTFTEVLPESESYEDTVEWVTPIQVDYADTNAVYIGYKPVFKSTDLGETFFPVTADSISGHRFVVGTMDNPDLIWIGDCYACAESDVDFRTYRSENAGSTWERMDDAPGFPDEELVVTACIHPDNADEIWMGCGRYSAGKKVYRSLDGGENWQNMSAGLPNLPVNVVLCDDSPGAPPGAVYAGTDIGVFYRNDSIGNWIFYSNGLPMVEVTDIDIDHLDQTLKIGTYGRGMWESPLFSACPPTLLLSGLNQIMGHSYFHSASNQIFSSARVDGYGSTVRYQAENRIYLTEGFRASAKNQATFKAMLQPCD